MVSRIHENAVIYDELDIADRIVTLKERGYLNSLNGKKLFLKTDSVCIHGDNEKAFEFIKLIKKALL